MPGKLASKKLCLRRVERQPYGHPCYAWSPDIEGTKKQCFYTVPDFPPVTSPADSV
jgi:hypothetical protein